MGLFPEPAPEKPKHSNSMAMAISFASLLTAVVMAFINAKVFPPAAVWICAVGFVIVAGAFLVPFLRTAGDKWEARRLRARVRRQYREPLLALSKALMPLSEQSCVYSAGSVVNQAINQKLLNAATANAYLAALSILNDRINDLIRFESSATDQELLRLVYHWLQSYVRICEGIFNGIQATDAIKDMPEGQWGSVRRSCNEIRQRGAALCSEYGRISYGIKAIDPKASVSEYLSPIPELVKEKQ